MWFYYDAWGRVLTVDGVARGCFVRFFYSRNIPKHRMTEQKRG